MRQRLPNRRPAETFNLELAGLNYKVTVGWAPQSECLRA
jgi:hypothetical protein